MNSALTARPAATPGCGFARIFSSLLAVATLLLSTSHPTYALPLTEEDELPPSHVIANHVVISEVQVDGDNGTNDEFIELYNPTDQAIDLGGWSIQYVSGGTAGFSITKKNFESVHTISAYGFFLIGRSDNYNGSVAPDMSHASISMRNDGGTIFLVNSTDDIGTFDAPSIVDKVAYGQASGSGTIYPEIAPIAAPGEEQSIERKAFYLSTLSDMNGAHASFGNSYDSGDNSQDFVLQTTPTPQSHSAGDTERCCTTVNGTIALQGQSTPHNIQVLLWPGSGLRTTTDSSGSFSIPVVPAIASEDTTAYTVEAVFPGYLSAKTALDLTSSLLSNSPVTFPALRLLAGDINADNRVNIFDLTIVGSQYGSEGVLPGDVNEDGKVNIQDLSLVSGNFGQTNQYSWSP